MNKYQRWTFQEILNEGSTIYGKSLSAAEAKSVLEFSHELAHDAFVLNKPEARHYAERLLYMIHVKTGFQAPVQPTLAMIWQPLMRAKMQADLQNYVDADGLSADEMGDLCVKAAEATEKLVHPLIDKCGAIKDRAPITIYTKNWYSSTHGFTHQLIALAIRADDDIKRTVFGNLAAEFGGEPHPERRKVWPRALGIDYKPETAVVDQDQMTEAFGLQNLRTGLACLQDPTYILGSFYTIESVFIGVSVRLLKAGLALGFDDKTLYHFREHAELDPTHSLEWLQTVKISKLTPEQRVNVVNGAYSQLHQRTKMFQAMDKHIFGSDSIPSFEKQGFKVCPPRAGKKAA